MQNVSTLMVLAVSGSHHRYTSEFPSTSSMPVSLKMGLSFCGRPIFVHLTSGQANDLDGYIHLLA